MQISPFMYILSLKKYVVYITDANIYIKISINSCVLSYSRQKYNDFIKNMKNISYSVD